MSQHFQFEANMSYTGANSDIRIPATPSQQKQVLKALTGGSTSGLPANLLLQHFKRKSSFSKAGDKGVIITGLPMLAAQTNGFLTMKVFQVL